MSKPRRLNLDDAAWRVAHLGRVTRAVQVVLVLIAGGVMALASTPGWSSSAMRRVERDVLLLRLPSFALDDPPTDKLAALDALDAAAPPVDPSLVGASVTAVVTLHVFVFLLSLAWIARARETAMALGRSASWVASRSKIDRFVPTRAMLLAIDRAADPNDVPLPTTATQRTNERSYRDAIAPVPDPRFPRWAATTDWITAWLWTLRLTFLASPFVFFAASGADSRGDGASPRMPALAFTLGLWLFGVVMTSLLSFFVVERILRRMKARLERLQARAAATS